MKRVLVLALVLAGCAVTPDRFSVVNRPSDWTAETRQAFVSLPTMGYRGVCDIARQVGYAYASPAVFAKDRAILGAELKRRGMTARDRELILDPDVTYGTGMTYRGLECAAGGTLSPNTAYYAGVGHRWQVPFGSGFVYLEGNGTPEGMRVTAWN